MIFQSECSHDFGGVTSTHTLQHVVLGRVNLLVCLCLPRQTLPPSRNVLCLRFAPRLCILGISAQNRGL